MHHALAIICAKPEELRQVIEVFDGSFTKDKGRKLTDQVYKLNNGETLLVTTCNSMGHMAAAVRTAQIITTNQPSVIMFVGTAASLKPDSIQIGDVVIPRKAINRIYEKVSEKGQDDYERRTSTPDFKELFFESNALISDISTELCSEDALSAISGVPIASIQLEKGDDGSIQIGDSNYALRKPKVYDDFDIFSCGMVVDSVSYRTFLTKLAEQNMRKVGIIDMESYGFFSAIKAAKLSGVATAAEGIMIRGVSDYAGRKQQTESLPAGWKEKSVRNAAIVAREVVARLTR